MASRSPRPPRGRCGSEHSVGEDELLDLGEHEMLVADLPRRLRGLVVAGVLSAQETCDLLDRAQSVLDQRRRTAAEHANETTVRHVDGHDRTSTP